MVYNTVDYISVRGVIQTSRGHCRLLYKQELGVMVYNTVDYISVRDVIQTRARGYGI